jgi:hypothetical protein
MANPTKGHEIPTIDVSMVTVEVSGGKEIALQTASKIAISVQSETEDSVKLVVKGKLIAQKPEQVTITGNTITLTDNVFNPELVKILQGGTIKYWSSAEQSTEGDTDAGFGVSSYTPPVAGSDDKGSPFTLNAYSAIYDAAGLVTGYEKIAYPNCQGTPVALNSEDNVFRAPEYTINSAPKTGEAPYKITYIKELPTVSSET